MGDVWKDAKPSAEGFEMDEAADSNLGPQKLHEEFEKVVSEVRNGKAVNTDCVPVEILKVQGNTG
jgi:hypothetical protein